MSIGCGLNVAERPPFLEEESGSFARTSLVRAGISWFVLTVRSCLESSAAAALTAKEYEAFLPTYLVKRSWCDRVKELRRPLFPGYLFCKFDPRRPLAILTTPGVVSIVSFGKVPAAVDETELNAVRTLVNSGLPVCPWPFLKEGQHVRVTRGPLQGMEGIFLKYKEAGYLLVVSVTLLQRSVSVELQSDRIQPLDYC
jgi:transcription antitermination factor NusG